MLYKIGEVAKLLGISPDLLRYYEKKGIVKPHKDKTNDYRYYEAWDINFLIELLWFKTFGYGMKDIARLVSDSSYDQLEVALEKKSGELAADIARRQQLLERLDHQRDDLARARAMVGRCDVQQSPDMLRYLNRHNFTYDESPKIQAAGRKGLEYVPYLRRCFEISLETIRTCGQDYDWGYALEMAYAQRLGVREEPPYERLRPQLSVHSVFSQPGKNNFTPRLVDHMVRFAIDNGFALAGQARGFLLCSVREHGQMTGYFEAWLPICDSEHAPGPQPSEEA